MDDVQVAGQELEAHVRLTYGDEDSILTRRDPQCCSKAPCARRLCLLDGVALAYASRLYVELPWTRPQDLDVPEVLPSSRY